jgi:hypothetical protein
MTSIRKCYDVHDEKAIVKGLRVRGFQVKVLKSYAKMMKWTSTSLRPHVLE